MRSQEWPHVRMRWYSFCAKRGVQLSLKHVTDWHRTTPPSSAGGTTGTGSSDLATGKTEATIRGVSAQSAADAHSVIAADRAGPIAGSSSVVVFSSV